MFFSCVNPFKALFPKKNNACISPHLLFLVNKFEISLTASIAELVPKDDDEDDFLTYSWMIDAMHSLCETHLGFTTLMTTDVDLPHVSDMEESLIEMYVDISSKLLDLCDAFTSELYRLNHGNMFLNIAFSNPDEFHSSHLDRWKQHMASKNPSIENCGKEEVRWGQAFVELQNMVKPKTRNTSLSKRFGVIRDLEAVESGVEKLYAAVQEGYLPVSDMEESMYADISSKLLEVCNAFTSELARLNHGNMLLKFAFSDPDEVSLSHIDCWRQHMASKNPRIENCGEVLSNLVESMSDDHDLHGLKKKNVIMNTFLSNRFMVIKDVKAVESGVEMVYAAVQEGSVPNSLMDDDKNAFLTVSWMIQAMRSLCETHQSIKTLVTDLNLLVSHTEESLMYAYSDISSKLLQLCDAFILELDRINHVNLLLKLAFSNAEEFSLSQFNCWRQLMASKNPSIENCGEVLSSLVESMNRYHRLYKKKQSEKAVESGAEKLYAEVQKKLAPNMLMAELLKRSVIE
ncbi:unnamed protein product, partial [Brassica rapa subsp. trilocularis]